MAAMFKTLCLLTPILLLLGCGERVTSTTKSRILLMGDSMMASNSEKDRSVADGIEAELREEVIDRSVPGAKYFYFLPISGATGLRIDAQFRPANWDVIVMNGGGNDLLFGGGCGTSTRQLTRLITPDGRHGAIPAFVANLRASGARVVYVGYLRNPGTFTPIKFCGPAGNELDRRLAKMAAMDKGVDFLPMADLVPHGDSSYHQFDRIHPSPKGSRAIANRIAEQIKTYPRKKKP
jgi:lysophospholipase L1-like esterase